MKSLIKIFLILFFSVSVLYGQTKEEKDLNAPSSTPYGGFKFDKKKGRYGKPFLVNSKEEAIDLLKSYYGDAKIKVGEIEERRRFFIIEILDEHDNLIDVILINKKSGRLRSIF